MVGARLPKTQPSRLTNSPMDLSSASSQDPKHRQKAKTNFHECWTHFFYLPLQLNGNWIFVVCLADKFSHTNLLFPSLSASSVDDPLSFVVDSFSVLGVVDGFIRELERTVLERKKNPHPFEPPIQSCSIIVYYYCHRTGITHEKGPSTISHTVPLANTWWNCSSCPLGDDRCFRL